MARRMLCLTKECKIDSTAAFLAFVRANEIDWTDLDALVWRLYDSALQMVTAVSE